MVDKYLQNLNYLNQEGVHRMKWAVSTLARRTINHEIQVRHCVGIIPANTQVEALGKAQIMSYKLYPNKEGWVGHDVVVQSVDDCHDVDEEIMRLTLEGHPDNS
jgi:uncharacterized protein YrzB (UPF0473 family)